VFKVKENYINKLANCKQKGFHLHDIPNEQMFEEASHAIDIDENANKISVKIIDLRIV
jgi:hypothetical protein